MRARRAVLWLAVATSVAATAGYSATAGACGHERCETAIYDVLGGASENQRWAGQLTLGYPWQRLRAQYGLTAGISPLVELETALGIRWRPSVGVGMRWLNGAHVRIAGEALAGWLVQTGDELGKRGPSGELRLRMLFPFGRVAPYLTMGAQYTVLFDRTRIERATGIDTDYSARGELTLWGTLGLAIAITRRIGIDVAIEAPWVNAPAISIPGIRLGLYIGGGPFARPRAR